MTSGRTRRQFSQGQAHPSPSHPLRECVVDKDGNRTITVFFNAGVLSQHEEESFRAVEVFCNSGVRVTSETDTKRGGVRII